MSDLKKYDFESLAQLLSHVLGVEKARASLQTAAQALGLRPGGTFELPTALELLDKVAETPGIVGVTARFARSRLHLTNMHLGSQDQEGGQG